MLIHKSSARNTLVPSSYLLFGLTGIFLIGALSLAITNFLTPRSDASAAFSAPADFQTYRDSQYNFSIAYPTGWQVTEQTEGMLSLAAPTTGGQVDVIAYDLDSEMSARSFALSKSASAQDSTFTDLKVGGYDAVALQAQSASTSASPYSSVYLTVGKHGYVIAGSASAQQFSQILNSFQAQ